MTQVPGDSELPALREVFGAYLAEHCTPADVRASEETDTGRSPQRWSALAAMGLVGLTIPAEFGGGGRDETWLAPLLEQAAGAALPEALGPVAVAAALLADGGSDAQRQEWLPRIAAGEAIVVASLPDRPLVDDAHVADLLLLTEGTEIHAVQRNAVDLVGHPAVDRGRRQFRVRATLTARSCLAVRARRAIDLAVDRARLAEAAALVGTAAKIAELAGLRGSGVHAADEEHLCAAAHDVEAARTALYRAAASTAGHAAARTADVTQALKVASRAAHATAHAALQMHNDLGEEHDLHLWLPRALQA